MVFGLEGPYATPYTAKPVADTCKLESSSCCGERLTGDIKTQVFLVSCNIPVGTCHHIATVSTVGAGLDQSSNFVEAGCLNLNGEVSIPNAQQLD